MKCSVTKRRWLGAGSALALVCAFVMPRAVAQEAASTAKTPASKATGVKTKATTKSHSASRVASGTHGKSTTAATARSRKSVSTTSRRSKKTVARGQQKIDPERAQAIQEALIREHYLTGEAAGTWNQASEDAMRRYQADHGWQSKTVPDARALISLGLGPSHDHLLNPETAMTTEMPPTHAATLTPVSHSPAPGIPMNTNIPNPSVAAPDHDSSQP